MIRSVAAAGAHGLLLTGGPIDPFNPNVIRASTGAIFELPMLSLDDHTLLTWLKQHGVQILAATPEATRSYTEVDMTGPTALLIGAEATGVPYEWLRHAQESGACVGIPMAPETVVDSLNAAVSAAVLLFEAVRQRG
jgi:TrmH family RNA methyltransferase